VFDRGTSELLGKMSWLGFDMTTSAALKRLLKEADARLKAQAQGSDTIIEAAVVVAVQLTSQTEEDDALDQADAEPASKKNAEFQHRKGRKNQKQVRRLRPSPGLRRARSGNRTFVTSSSVRRTPTAGACMMSAHAMPWMI
jgi:hypothetical protein